MTINPEDCGKRVLLRNVYYGTNKSVFSGKITEIAGDFFRFYLDSGSYAWYECSEYEIVEYLNDLIVSPVRPIIDIDPGIYYNRDGRDNTYQPFYPPKTMLLNETNI